MSLRISEEYKVLEVVAPISITADLLSSAISVEEYENDGLAIVQVGAITGSDTTLNITVKGSATSGGTYTTIGTFTEIATTDDNEIASVAVDLGASASKFIKFNYDIAGTDTPTALVSGVLLARVTTAKSDINSVTSA